MAPLTRSTLLLLALLATATVFATGQDTYRLPRTHSFTVGDVEISHFTFSKKGSAFRLPDSGLTDSWSLKETEHRRTEVLEIDAKGQPVLLRLHIVQSTRQVRVTTPAENRGKWITVLKDVRFLLRGDGSFFKPDSDTVTVPAGTKLAQSQVAYLREYLDKPHSMLSFRPNVARLLPTHQVKPLESWKPSKATLDAYSQRDARFVATNTKATSAEYKLLRVSSGVATIAGRMSLTGNKDGFDLTDDWAGETDLDLKTGLWVRWTRKAKIIKNAKDRRSKSWIESNGTTDVVSGDGAASELPAGLVPVELPEPASKHSGK